jgi:long-subunit acyl-CoA synthetase (AMP-forming)
MRFDAPYTLPGVMARAAALYGDAPAIVTDAGRLSFRQLADAAGAVAAAFAAAGVRKGDRVGIWAPNSAEWIIAAIGIALTGAVLVPLNTRLKGKEAAFILRRSGARMLLTVGEFLGTCYPELLADESLPALERMILLSGMHETAGGWQEFLATSSSAGAASASRTARRTSPLRRAISPTSCSRRERPARRRAS